MVKKKSNRIARNPKTQASTAEVDEWVTQGGIDPETADSKPLSTEQETTSDKPESKEKKYPHRISFDLDKAQYKRLKWASFDSDRTMNEILREAVEDWMKIRDY